MSRASVAASSVLASLLRIWILLHRELRSYFVAAGTYIVLFAVYTVQIFFLLVIAWTARGDLFQIMDAYFSGFSTILIVFFLPPVITMRLLSDERAKGTLEMLVSAPIADFEVVISKYLSACAVMAVVWLPSAIFIWVLGQRAEGTPDYGPVLSAMIGLGVMSAFLLAVGLFASALTEEQVVAAALGLILNVVFALLGWMYRSAMPDPSQTHGLRVYNPIDQLSDFSSGVVDSRTIAMYLSLTAFMLFGTLKLFEGRRWR